MNCKFKVGDKVRIVTETLTDVIIYVVVKVVGGTPCKYDIKDDDGHVIVDLNEGNLELA